MYSIRRNAQCNNSLTKNNWDINMFDWSKFEYHNRNLFLYLWKYRKNVNEIVKVLYCFKKNLFLVSNRQLNGEHFSKIFFFEDFIDFLKELLFAYSFDNFDQECFRIEKIRILQGRFYKISESFIHMMLYYFSGMIQNKKYNFSSKRATSCPSFSWERSGIFL